MLMPTLLLLVGAAYVVSQNVKLVPGPSEGRLQVNYNGTWGTVCLFQHAYQAATVVCRSLNQPSNHSYAMYTLLYGPPQVNPGLFIVACNGTENSIFDCNLTQVAPKRTCSGHAIHSIAIKCTNEKLPALILHWNTEIQPHQTIDMFEKDRAGCCALNSYQPISSLCDVRQTVYTETVSCCALIYSHDRSFRGQANCTAYHWKYNSFVSRFVNVLYPPESFMTSDVKVLEYSSVNITLVNLPNPLPYQTTWRKTGTRLTWHQTEAYRNFRNISRLDGGEFLVNITNRMVVSNGTIREAWGQELLHIDVLYKPTVSCPREYVVVKGKNINITCNIDSNPAPDLYIWTNPSGENVQQGTQPTLTLTAVGPGTIGRYKCTAINKMESTNGTIQSGFGSGDVLVTIGGETQVFPRVTGSDASKVVMSTITPSSSDDNTYMYILTAVGVVALVATVILVIVVIRMRNALKEKKGDGKNRDEVTERDGRVEYSTESDYTSLDPPEAEKN